jgi:hypothetical protein
VTSTLRDGKTNYKIDVPNEKKNKTIKKRKWYVLLCYNLLIKKSIKRFSFISYILILKNLDYERNNKCYIIIIFFFLGGEDKNYMPRGAKFLNIGLGKLLYTRV